MNETFSSVQLLSEEIFLWKCALAIQGAAYWSGFLQHYIEPTLLNTLKEEYSAKKVMSAEIASAINPTDAEMKAQEIR